MRQTKTWKIKSSKEDKYYTVVMFNPASWECDCPHYQFRHTDCRHINIVRKKYDQQNKKHRLSRNETQQSPIPSDNRELGNKGDNLSKQKLLGDSVDNGVQADLPERMDQRPGGANLPSQPTETSLGEPTPSINLPRPSQTEPNAEIKGSTEDCTENLKEQLLKEKQKQTKLKEQWETRITEYSKDGHKKLAQLKQQYKATKERSKREIIILQAKVIKMGIRASNKKDFKSKCPFPTNLIETDIESLTEEECQQYKMFIALD